MRLIRVAPSTRFDLHKICTCRGVMPHLSAASWTVIYPYIANTSQIAHTKSHYNYIRLSEIKQSRICNLQKKKRRPQGTILPTGGVPLLLALLQVLDILLCQLTGRFPALCAVWGVQLETEPPFPHLKCKTTVLIIIHQPALVRVLSRILAQTLFKGSTVGTHINKFLICACKPPVTCQKISKYEFDECYQAGNLKIKTQCLCGFAGHHIHFLLTQTLSLRAVWLCSQTARG